LSQFSGEAKSSVTPLETLQKRISPPLKWAGGKRWLIPQLESLWQRHETRRYVEPFCGGLAAVLGLMPATALLNDINPHLINFYKHIQSGLQLRIEMRNDETLYYQHRRRFNELISKRRQGTAEAAQLFYYLNRTCFNGLCRFNQRGEFNVPFGSYHSISYARGFNDLTTLLQNWTFSSCDINTLQLEPEDFVYADPPYDVEFTTYSAGGFTWKDQERTAELLSKHRGPVVISNQATDRIVSLYQQLGFTVHYLNGPRRISCTGDRTAAKEVLAVNRVFMERQ
jgi:DNA adenine methylase